MRRLLIGALIVMLAVGIAAPFLNADYFRPRITAALETGLSRRVEVGAVHYNLFTGPGFNLEDVTIHEDPSMGIEPFAYVQSLEARVRILSLLAGRLEFSSLRLVATTVNLVKSDAGPWNFQLLADRGPAAGPAPRAILVRSGRVNFKFGDTKSVFYFNDADLDVSPAAGGVEVRFSGAPSRTDRAAQNFGRLYLRANVRGGQADVKVELERSAIADVARLLDQRDLGLHGLVAFEARLTGPPNSLQVAGQLHLDDIHRWDLLPPGAGGWALAFRGLLDVRAHNLELESPESPGVPVVARLRVLDYLARPQWAASLELKQLPAATFLAVARHMGAALPPKVGLDGTLSGVVGYVSGAGLGGAVSLADASLRLPDGDPLRVERAELAVAGERVDLLPSTVRVGESQSAELEGAWEQGALDLKISTHGLNVAAFPSFGLGVGPVLDHVQQGVWRGWTRFRRAPDGPGEWSGEFDLQNARVDVEGVADPLRIQAAAVSVNGARVSVNRLRARAGAIAFGGEYRYEPAVTRPHRFRLSIPQAALPELERLLMPTLVRERGFLARTLRLGRPAALPEWLMLRRVDGSIAIDTLAAGDGRAQSVSARLLWDGPVVRLTGLQAGLDPGVASGAITVDLTGPAPRYHLDGKLQDLAYKGGRLELEGTLDTAGRGVELLWAARAEGRLRGRAIAFSPDAEFRTVSGCFDLVVSSGAPRWTLSGLEISQGGETWYGQGVSQSDGRLVLDLTSGLKKLRYSGTMFAMNTN